jgi:hypothetical protein
LYIRNDSTIIEQKRENNVSTQRFAGRGMIANGLGVSIRYFLPFWGRYAPKHVGDSVTSGHLTLGTNKKLTIKRTAQNKLYAGSTVMGMVTLHLDKNAKVVSIDAIGSSWNVTGKKIPYLDINQLAVNYYLEEQRGGGIRTINRPDSVEANISDASIKIYYSRPQVRGRTIFGSIVPWERVWRTGANAATRIVTNRPLYFQGGELPAGSYSIFTIPTPEGWTLMFNSQANIWGTEYNPLFDVLHVQMVAGTSQQFTETMTIEIQPAPTGGSFNILWENIKASVPFSTSRL